MPFGVKTVCPSASKRGALHRLLWSINPTSMAFEPWLLCHMNWGRQKTHKRFSDGPQKKKKTVPGTNGTKWRFYCGIKQQTAGLSQGRAQFVPGTGPFCPRDGSCLSRRPSRPKCLCLLVLFWGENLTRGFPNRGVSHFFRERSRLCRGPFRDCSSWLLLIGREKGKGEIGKVGKAPKGPKRKDKSRGRSSPRLTTPPPPPV